MPSTRATDSSKVMAGDELSELREQLAERDQENAELRQQLEYAEQKHKELPWS